MSKAKLTPWVKQNMKIDELSLWDENARFPDKYFKKSENELIKYFLSDKTAKLKEFAREVVKDFDLPQLEKIVIFSYKGKDIVLEGNRRVAVYKLLANPLLAGDLKTEGFFKGLKTQIKIAGDFKLEVVKTDKKKEGLRYVDRKHTKNNNEVPWGVQERRHHSVRQGIRASTDVFTVELGKIVNELDLPDEMKEKVLGKGTVTTFYRLMESEPARKILAFEKTQEGKIVIKNKKDFEEKLKVIIFDLLAKKKADGKKLDSRELNKTEDKESYLRSITPKDFKRVETEINTNTETNMFGQTSVNMGTLTGTPGKKGTVKVKPSFNRKKVLPKLKRLIDECYSLDDNTHPNAKIAFSRVLFECVLKYIVEETEYNSKKLRNYSHFDKAFKKKGVPLPYTNFAELKKAFVSLISNVGKQNAFNQFDLDKLNQVIHNYNHGAAPGDARTVSENLIVLIEFMLQDEKDLLNSLDKTKLV